MKQDNTSRNSKRINKSKSLSSSDKHIAAIPKEAFKSMFYLFAARPDSITKVYDRRIIVTTEEICRLNNKIVDKLKLHQIDQIVSSASLKLRKQKIIQFGTWAEFIGFDWKSADVTEEINLRWDFLIKLDEFTLAQRHTLTVKISTAPNPRDVFQIFLSQETEDDDIDGKFGICLARVDFISHRLADELIAIVHDWNTSLRQPESACDWFSKLVKYDQWIARIIHYSIPIFFTLLSLALLNIYIPDTTTSINTSDMKKGARWILLSGIGLYSIVMFGRYTANRCCHAINQYGAFTPFQITRGDENLVLQIKGQNNRQIVIFFLSTGFTLALNVFAGIITWIILP